MSPRTHLKFVAIVSLCFGVRIASETTSTARADTSGVSVRASDPTPVPSTQTKPTIYHVFGGQRLDLPLNVRGNTKHLDLRARLVQIAFMLEAPVGDNLNILSGVPLNGDTPLKTHVSLPLPDVRDQTDFELRYQCKTEKSEWLYAGHTRLRLYSQKILEPLKPLAQNVVLRLKDEGDALRPLLKDLDISVTDHRSPVHPPESPAITLIIRENKDPNPSDLDDLDLQIHKQESVVVFNEEVRSLPKIVKTSHRGGHLIQVDLEVIRHLRHDPRAQKTFMEIIQLAHPDPHGENQ